MAAIKNQSSQIAKMLGARLPQVDGALPSTEWLAAFYEKIGREPLAGANITALIRHAIENLGGNWRPRHITKDGKATPAAVSELSELVGIRLALHDRLGLKKRPFVPDYELWEALHEELYNAEDVPQDLRSVSSKCLAAIFDSQEDALPSELFATAGVPSKVAQQEVLAYFERKMPDPASQPTVADEREDETDAVTDAAGDLALTSTIDGTPLNLHLPAIIDNIDDEDLILDPPWQRGDIWSLAKKRSLVESLLLGIPLPSIILHWEKDRTITVIDGKQRLTAIHQFTRDEWPLGRYPDETPLADVSGGYYSALPDWARRKIKNTQVPVLKFEGLSPGVLYRIFELYNVTGIRLNAVEIRNAVFHAHPIHRMAFDLAGEREDADCFFDTPEEQAALTSLLRTTVSPSGQPDRYATLDFLCRYLAYSRVPQSPRTGQFSAESTARIIRTYFDTVARDEDPRALAMEIKNAFVTAASLFHTVGVDPFAVKSGTRPRFNRLRATTSLVMAMIVNRAKEINKVEDIALQSAVAKAVADIPYPEKQQTLTIWRFQAANVCSIVESLQLESSGLDRLGLTRLVETMRSLL